MTKPFPIFLGVLITLGIAVVAAQVSPASKKPDRSFSATCGHQLREKLCFVDRHGVAECNLDDNRFDVLESKLTAIFDHSPNQVRQKLCEIGAISVNYPANGIEPWMSAFTNYEVIGINMFNWINLGVPFKQRVHAFLTWYSSEDGGYAIENSEKIKVRFSKDSSFQMGLSYALARDIFHEVGHLVQADLKHNPFNCLRETMTQKTLPFVNASGDAYCERYIAPQQDETLLTKLQASEHVSYYASCTAYEDFAETYAAYLMSETLNRKYQATLDDTIIYSQSDHFKTPKVQEKLRAIANIMSFDTSSEKERDSLNRHLSQCTGPFSKG